MSHLDDVAIRFWDELASRSSGPLAFRFFLQPPMATFLAIRDGWRDARFGRRPYLWTAIRDCAAAPGRLAEGLGAFARVLLLGIGMDALYQCFTLKAFRPLALANIVILLAFVPYLMVRGPVDRIAAWWRASAGDADSTWSCHG